MELDPSRVVFVEGIGCHGHLVNFLNTNHFEGLHGRPLPVAQGIKLANHELNVFVATGDGDCLGEGGNHFLHALRRNVDLVCLIFNNQRYSLTTGQASPTTEKGNVTKTSPFGLIEEELNPIALAIARGGSFVARSFAGDVQHLKETIIKAHQHRGLAVVDILQPCVTFNKVNTFQYFRERVYKLEDLDGYDPHDKSLAVDKAFEWGQKVPIGVFYREEKPTYESQLAQISEQPLVEQSLKDINLDKILREYQ